MRAATCGFVALLGLSAAVAVLGCGGGGGSSGANSAPPPVIAANYDLVAFWETSTASGSNPFYTTDYEDKHASIFTDGNLDRGVAAWLPCATPETTGPGGRTPDPAAVHAELGYATLSTVPMQYACAQPANTAALYRLDLVDAAGTSHLYTSSDAEALSALASGWRFERVEGYLFTSAVAGSAPLFRLSRCVAAGGGCRTERRYTISADARSALVGDGWTDEGVAGYAFGGFDDTMASVSADGNVNGIPTSVAAPVHASIVNVAPPKQYIPVDGIDSGRPAATVSGYLVSESTSRPAGATQQRLTFTLDTGTLFDTGSNIDHLPVFLRFHAELGSDGFPGLPYDGLGIFFAMPGWNGNHCHALATTGAQVFVELVADANRMVNGTLPVDFVDCSANLVAPLASGRLYAITVTVTDGAKLAYTVTDVANGARVGDFGPHDYSAAFACPFDPVAGALSTANAYCANPMSPDRFASSRSGYLIWPLFTREASSAQGGLQNVTVQWLDANGNVLSSQ